jgi:CRISPR-associated protein Cmr3
MLAHERVDLAAFARGEIRHAELGTPAKPGTFAVRTFQLARRFADGRVEVLVAPPADLVISEHEDKTTTVRRLHPQPLAQGLLSSSALPWLPVLAEDKRGKPASGYWLTQAGWQSYLTGDVPAATELIKSSALWGIDHRVGVGLDADTRRAADGKLFSVQAVAMKKREHEGSFDVGFVAVVTGATLPKTGMLRLGGDGRAAAMHSVTCEMPKADFSTMAKAKRCRIVLSSPGIFAEGWRPTGVDAEGRFDLHGVRGRLVCAAVARAETVSGWDLSQQKPKPAQRVAPTGSVYWLDELDTTPEALGKLAAGGLWTEPCEDARRRAEGFNRIAIAAWSQGETA